MSPDNTTPAVPGRFLTARWVHLVMLNYEVDPALLRDHVPAGTLLDSWEGKHFVSMVGFQFLDTRVLGLPFPFHRNFDEVNLRFYVRREVGDEVRRGVVFVKEIVPRAVIAWMARALYNENYVALPMDHTDRMGETEPAIEYRWTVDDRTERLGARPAGPPAIPTEGQQEHFIAEHYWGYSRQRDGGTVEYRVEHPPWEVYRAQSPVFECDVASLYGPEFVQTLSAPPSSCFIAKGSDIIVRRGRRI